MYNLREYQKRLSNDANEILKLKKIVCLFMEVRTGKTATALNVCKLYNAKKVLFITKIKAFESIENDYFNFGFIPCFDLKIINKESLHKITENDFDVLIIDEVHGFSSYPKANVYHKSIKNRFGNVPMILLSGTPTPESYSQFYHILNLSNHSPFSKWANFYKWAKDFVNVKQLKLGHGNVNDYSDARKNDFWHLIRYYILTHTQKEANFRSVVNENVLFVQMQPITHKICDTLIKKRVVNNTDNTIQIVADTSVVLQQKLHQLYSGTIKLNDKDFKIIDNSKAVFIKEHFKNKKVAIFYKFKAELQMLKDVLGDVLTTDLKDFNESNKSIALQFVTGREGISLAKAECLIMFNIDFSAVTYWQSRDRLTTIDGKENKLYWLFSKDGIESKIYEKLKSKQSYTTSLFKKDYGI